MGVEHLVLFSSTNDNLSATTGEFDFKRSTIEVSPNIGIFVIDKFAVGLKSSLSWIKNKGVAEGREIGIGIATRFDYVGFPKVRP